jgi:hypothetical protein
MLGIEQAELAKRARVARGTVRRMITTASAVHTNGIGSLFS